MTPCRDANVEVLPVGKNLSGGHGHCWAHPGSARLAPLRQDRRPRDLTGIIPSPGTPIPVQPSALRHYDREGHATGAGRLDVAIDRSTHRACVDVLRVADLVRDRGCDPSRSQQRVNLWCWCAVSTGNPGSHVRRRESARDPRPGPPLPGSLATILRLVERMPSGGQGRLLGIPDSGAHQTCLMSHPSPSPAKSWPPSRQGWLLLSNGPWRPKAPANRRFASIPVHNPVHNFGHTGPDSGQLAGRLRRIGPGQGGLRRSGRTRILALEKPWPTRPVDSSPTPSATPSASSRMRVLLANRGAPESSRLACWRRPRERSGRGSGCSPRAGHDLRAFGVAAAEPVWKTLGRDDQRRRACNGLSASR